MSIGKMITYEDSKSFRTEHELCHVEETSGDRIVRILCKTHNKSLIASIPDKTSECEVCEQFPHAFKYGMWLCQSCLVKEGNQRAINQFEMKKRALATLDKSDKINSDLKIKEDIFNAETLSLVALEKAVIEANNDIPETEAYYKFASRVKDQIGEYKKLISQKHEEILDIGSRVRASQQHLNNVANKLRAEVREEFKLRDAAYKPEVVKVKPVKTLKPTSSKALGKAVIRERVAKLQAEGILIANEYLFTMQLIRHNNDVDKAEAWIRRSFKEITSEIEETK